ncbi:TetR/AcrR family transcriptional regulator [Pseudonocardia ailaonensis]|uniref:TetR/AcrR family transcriptional regulator n=1 Tax=Pseudonocardia ailaonensis TaxID=367279 RepID=A0ABN2N6U4_9PSEU
MSVAHDNDGELTDAKRLIVRHAAALFRRKGFLGTSMRDIADAVGMSKAGIYHHYPTKERLLQDIVGVGADALDAQLREVMDSGASTEDRLDCYFRSRMRTIAEYQDVLTVIWQERPTIGDGLFESVARRLERYRAGVVELIAEGQRSGVVRADLDAHLMALAVDGMTGWAYLWYRDNGGQTPEQIGGAFWSMLWDSMRSG